MGAHVDYVAEKNIDYTNGAGYADDKDRLDVYMPPNAEGVPVVVYFHGGALMEGEKALAKGFARRLVANGIGCVASNYRLSPTVMHPEHARDAAMATAWTLNNIAQFGGDPGKVFVAGHSAGGYLAALIAIAPEYPEAHGFGPDAIRGAIPVSPFLYVEETAKDRPKIVWGEDPEDWLAASVTPHIDASTPMLLLYADGDDDWRRRQNETLAAAMNAAGNADVTAVELPDRDHRTLIERIEEDSDEVAPRIAAFIAAH